MKNNAYILWFPLSIGKSHKISPKYSHTNNLYKFKWGKICSQVFFLMGSIFQRSFRFTAIMKGTYRYFPHTPYSHTCVISQTVDISHHSGTLVASHEPKLTNHYQPKSIVCIRVHFWCCMSYDFCQMYSDLNMPL